MLASNSHRKYFVYHKHIKCAIKFPVFNKTSSNLLLEVYTCELKSVFFVHHVHLQHSLLKQGAILHAVAVQDLTEE
jgi:hypothetical protein